MTNKDIIAHDTNRDGIDRCGFLKCNGCAGTAKACSVSCGKLASRMKSRSKIAGAAIAAALLTAGASYACDENTTVLANSNQGQYSVTYVHEQTPTIALSVHATRSNERSRAAETTVEPQSIRIGQGNSVTYFKPTR